MVTKLVDGDSRVGTYSSVRSPRWDTVHRWVMCGRVPTVS